VSAPVVVGSCQGCGACLLTCPERALRPVGPGPGAGRRPAALVVDAARCTGCGECVEVCPVGAVSFATGPGSPS